MRKLEARLGSETIRALIDLHREIRELKYLYLKVVQSHSASERLKSDLKDGVVELAGQINDFFNDLRFRRINKFNIEDTEAGMREFARSTRRRIGRLLKAGLKALPPRPKGGRGERSSGSLRLDSIPASEAEIDSTLLRSRVFDERALEKDKLDYLNAVKSFLVDATGPSPDQERATKARKGSLEGELLQLKIRNYVESLAGYQSSNPEILYRVRARIEKAFREGAKVNVIGVAGAHPAAPNHGELYLLDQNHGNYSLSFRDRSLALLLEISLYQPLQASGLMYAGEVSGWAEAGVNRVAFALKDRQLPETEAGAAAVAFLMAAGLQEIYERMGKAREEKATEVQRLQQKVERDMKQKVCEALDGSL